MAFGAICPWGAIGALAGAGVGSSGVSAYNSLFGTNYNISTGYRWGGLAGGLIGGAADAARAGAKYGTQRATQAALMSAGPEFLGAGVGGIIGYNTGGTSGALHGATIGMMVGGLSGGLAARGLWSTRRAVTAETGQSSSISNLLLAASGTGQKSRKLANPDTGTLVRGLRVRIKLRGRFRGLYRSAQRSVARGRQRRRIARFTLNQMGFVGVFVFSFLYFERDQGRFRCMEVCEMRDANLRTLVDVFSQVPDPRNARGVRYPFSGVLSLVFIGMLCRIREMAVLQAWAETHWDVLQRPLGFPRNRVPHATTISRALAKFSVAEFQDAFVNWLLEIVNDDELQTVAVDGKTSCQSYDAEGSPILMLNAFAHHAKVTIAQWSVRGEKTNEPGVLRNHLKTLLADFPMLRLITGDAIFAQRPLVELLQETGLRLPASNQKESRRSVRSG